MIKRRKYLQFTLLAAGMLLMTGGWARAQALQSLTVEECYRLARENYPMLKQTAIIEKTKEYTLDNISKGYLPQFNLNGQATYQSAVTSVPVSLPGINIPTVSKDQYKVYTEISQPLTEMVPLKVNKELAAANAVVEEQKIEVMLYQLRERVNNFYFGILLLDAQIEQVVLLKKDIQNGIDKTKAAIANGVALKSSVNTLQAEMLKANQRTIELQSARKGYAEMLGLFIHRTIDSKTVLTKPLPQVATKTINRPELRLYDIQKDYLNVQKKMVDAKNIPRLGLFMQGGYGRPALNMLNNDFDFYYIGGLRLNWNLTGYYTAKKEKKMISLNQDALDIQKETFLLNTSISLSQQNIEVSKYRTLVTTDDEIISLRETVKNTSKSQLENGTVTTNDFLADVNAEDQAKQSRILHNIQLLMAQYNYQTTSGN
jgi:outer membrane protein TolC